MPGKIYQTTMPSPGAFVEQLFHAFHSKLSVALILCFTFILYHCLVTPLRLYQYQMAMSLLKKCLYGLTN